MVKKIQHIQVSASKRFVPLKNSRRDSSSSELSSTEYLTSSSSELSSFASITTCDCLTGCSNKCDYLVYINKEERKMAEISQTRKKLSKRRKPSEMPTTALKKLGSNKNSKKKTHEVPKKNFYLSDSSNDCDCNSCYTHCDCKRYSSKNKQGNLKNKRKKIMPSKSRGKFTKAATTSESLKNRKISKKSAIKSSEKKKTSLFDPYSCNCNSRDTKYARGSSKSLRESKKSVKNAKSLSSKKVSRTGSSERYLSSFSSEDTEYNTEFFSSDEDSRGHCCGNIRESRRKIKH